MYVNLFKVNAHMFHYNENTSLIEFDDLILLNDLKYLLYYTY